MAEKKEKKTFKVEEVPTELDFYVSCSIGEFRRMRDFEARRLFLYGPIVSFDDAESDYYGGYTTTEIIEDIVRYNRIDKGIPPEERKPVILYINSPGGSITEGFSLISAIELSKTPIYTVNIGEWDSLSFLIGITGHKRMSLPYMTFLMHDGSIWAQGSTSKLQDQMDFHRRFEREIIKQHVLKHSNMKSIDYDALARVEVYMLPEDALERGFIDEIITDIDAIL